MKRKYVRIENEAYCVRIRDGKVIAEKTVFPQGGWTNCYGTGYEINAYYSKKFGAVEIYCWNDGYQTRGRPETDIWTESIACIEKSDAREIITAVSEKFNKAENGTTDVKEVFEMVMYAVINICGDDFVYVVADI